MKISFDPEKNAENVRTRGLPFDRVKAFDFETAMIVRDKRRAYPEPRFQALGFLEGRLHMLVYSPLIDGIRIISFRKANAREERKYEKTSQS